VWGIGFKTADTIARAVGIALDDPERIQAGVPHALGDAANQKHTLLPKPDLLVQAVDLLGADSGVDWATAWGWLAARQWLYLAPAHEAAVQLALTYLVSILTGGPGTGKTHTPRALLALALNNPSLTRQPQHAGDLAKLP
jgi:ATP-dependent exoDNAse (exonuclease V) alpha subunit